MDDVLSISVMLKQIDELKKAEKKYAEHRKAVEAQLAHALNVDASTHEGTLTFKDGGYTAKIVGKMTTTVDGKKLQELATANNLREQIPDLFRWSYTVNKRNWDKAPDPIKEILSEAITTKPASLSVSVTKDEEENE